MSPFAKESKRPLLQDDDSSVNGDNPCSDVKLFSADSMLEMKSTVCEGYVVLLAGTLPEQSKAQSSPTDQTQSTVLGYAALMDGNVIDSCFGLCSYSKEKGAARTMCQEAKNAIDTASMSSDSVEHVAVNAYKHGFQLVMDMNAKLNKLNFFTACFLEKKIRQKALSQLETNFRKLERAIAQAEN